LQKKIKLQEDWQSKVKTLTIYLTRE
jgi:hypothetical protein